MDESTRRCVVSSLARYINVERGFCEKESERERKVHKRPNDENIASTFDTCSFFTLSAGGAGACGTVAVFLC